MKTQIRSKTVDRLTKREVEECAFLTHRKAGMMEDALRGIYNESPYYKTKGRAIMLRDSNNGTLLSWCLLFGNGIPRAYFYTHKDYRRKGYGTLVYNHAKRFEPNMRVFPTNYTNTKFFRSVNGQQAPGYDWVE